MSNAGIYTRGDNECQVDRLRMQMRIDGHGIFNLQGLVINIRGGYQPYYVLGSLDSRRVCKDPACQSRLRCL